MMAPVVPGRNKANRPCRGKPQHGEALTLSRKSRGAVFQGEATVPQ